MRENRDFRPDRIREQAEFDQGIPQEASFLSRAESERTAIAARRRGRLAASGRALVVVAALIALSMSAGPARNAGTAPMWLVEITAAGNSPVTALVYGEEAGVHLVRVPAASAGSDGARVIATRLANGDLHMVSLGWSSLRARASSPPGTPRATWTAESRFITAYHNDKGTGVRTW